MAGTSKCLIPVASSLFFRLFRFALPSRFATPHSLLQEGPRSTRTTRKEGRRWPAKDAKGREGNEGCGAGGRNVEMPDPRRVVASSLFFRLLCHFLVSVGHSGRPPVSPFQGSFPGFIGTQGWRPGLLPPAPLGRSIRHSRHRHSPFATPHSPPATTQGEADDVWSWTMRQPSEVLRKSRVNRPCGVSPARVRRQRPKARAASGPRTWTSRSEKSR